MSSYSFYYNSLINKFINIILEKGKKELSENLIIDLFKKLKLQNFSKNKDPLLLLTLVIRKLLIYVELRSMRVGRIKRKYPISVKSHRQLYLAFKLLLDGANCRTEFKLSDRLYNEIINIAYNEKLSNSINLRYNLYQEAFKNRIFVFRKRR